VDFAGVATGNFNREAIEAAVEQAQVTPLGTPLVKVEYAKRKFYVSANIGFVVLTSRTAVFGNETGIRRVLDRLEAGRVRVEVADEIATLLDRPGAPVAFGSDASRDTHVIALTQKVPGLAGLQMARVLGNFDAPGLNFAGTLTYPDAAAAEGARAGIHQLHQNITQFTWIGSVFGIAQPIKSLDVTTHASSVQFKLALDSSAAQSLLQQFGSVMGVPP
jgi:hypothetical protein